MNKKGLHHTSPSHYWLLYIQFDALEALGYSAIGVGFLEDDVHTVGTKEASQSMEDPRMIKYLRAVIIASMFMSVVMRTVHSIAN